MSVAWTPPAIADRLLVAVRRVSGRSCRCAMLKSAGARIKVAGGEHESPDDARPSGAFCPGSIAMGNMPMIIASAVISTFLAATGYRSVNPPTQMASPRHIARQPQKLAWGDAAMGSPAPGLGDDFTCESEGGTEIERKVGG
jgi:hypothetical protein